MWTNRGAAALQAHGRHAMYGSPAAGNRVASKILTMVDVNIVKEWVKNRHVKEKVSFASVGPGERVHYFSTSRNAWVVATLKRLDHRPLRQKGREAHATRKLRQRGKGHDCVPFFGF